MHFLRRFQGIELIIVTYLKYFQENLYQVLMTFPDTGFGSIHRIVDPPKPH